ncbi:MAG: glycoside hydrolase family 2 TIM barrel-domain containing protein [Clostridia bacterium]|nr:glycoside hydrolase family 2 TIM barrel-domain containing protein [Clostridia bacterium]
MTRLFKRYEKRKNFTLDGLWDYCFDEENVGIDEKWYENFPENSQKMYVPGCWNLELGMIYKVNLAVWFRTEFEINSDNINIIFGAVHNECDVYIDGKHVMYHYGGFCEFSKTLQGIGKGKHTLVLRITDINNAIDTIPLTKVDWFHYGGIMRSVEIEELNDAWIKSVRVDYDLDDALKNVSVHASAEIEAFDTAFSDTLKLYINDELVAKKALNGTETVVFDDILLNDINLWGIFKPNLYTVRFELESDDLAEKIGFRKIETRGRDILLNGEKIFLKGVNRHEEHPDWGFAMPKALIKKDIEIIRELGCNAIRGSHYPNSKWTLDYLDSIGMLFWEEIPMWGFPENAVKNPKVLERGVTMHTEMVMRDYHHPCIIFWGMHNEIDTTIPEARELTKSYIEAVKAIDPKHRLTTYASDKDVNDICFDLVDVISSNKYVGWYGPGTVENFKDFLAKFKEYRKKMGVDDKPLIMSEFGAGGIYGENRLEAVKWSENFQADYDAYATKLFMDDPDISGTYLWQYCDMRSAQSKELERPRSYNNKGLLNEYRCPKQVFFEIKKLYTQND